MFVALGLYRISALNRFRSVVGTTAVWRSLLDQAGMWPIQRQAEERVIELPGDYQPDLEAGKYPAGRTLPSRSQRLSRRPGDQLRSGSSENTLGTMVKQRT